MTGNVCLTTDHQLLSIINNNIYSSSHKLMLLIRLAGETGVLPHHLDLFCSIIWSEGWLFIHFVNCSLSVLNLLFIMLHIPLQLLWKACGHLIDLYVCIRSEISLSPLILRVRISIRARCTTKYENVWLCLLAWWCLTPLSTLFQLYRGG
jgi:hypothetical protein